MADETNKRRKKREAARKAALQWHASGVTPMPKCVSDQCPTRADLAELHVAIKPAPLPVARGTVTIVVNPNDMFSGRMVIEMIEQIARLAGQHYTIKVLQDHDHQA